MQIEICGECSSYSELPAHDAGIFGTLRGRLAGSRDFDSKSVSSK
jgi:hypothetical protein